MHLSRRWLAIASLWIVCLWLVVAPAATWAQNIVDPPAVIETLSPAASRYTPSISIQSPQAGETINSLTVPLTLQVQRFPMGQDERTGLGLHVKVIVDNDEPIDYFDLDEPLMLTVTPGTHTVRAVAARPWDRSYRNLAAFSYVTFNAQTEDGQNSPIFREGSALLTVVSPSGSYGAEPILLDYIVDGVNLGSDARGGASVRYTLNGNSVITRARDPIYLTGWQPGPNELLVELLQGDETLYDNQGTGFTQVRRTITYTPGGEDALSQLVRGELTPSDMAGTVGPDPFILDERGTPQRLR